MSNRNSNSHHTFDPEIIHDLANGNIQFMKEMVAIFIEDVPVACNEMNTALSRSDMKTLGELAHKVKSSVGMIGATNLHALVANIENEAIAGNANNTVGSLLEKLDSEVSTCCSDLKTFVDSL